MAEDSINQREMEEALVPVEETQISAVAGDDTPSISSGKKNSAVWEHYKRLEDPNSGKVQCLYCSKHLVYRSSTGTSSLKKHLTSCVRKKISDNKQSQISSAASTEMSVFRFSQERSREDVARFVIMCEQAFSVVDHPAFRIMLSNLRPKFKQHKRVTVTKDCIKLYEKEKTSMKDVIANSHGRISLTTDTWTSCQTKGFMSLTAHYVDNQWKLQKKIINFVELDERHTGIVLSLKLEKCISDWNIDDKLFSITMDNVSTNNVVASLIKAQHKSSLPSDGIFFHVRCSAHILNLIVKEGLKDLDAGIVRIRNAVKFVTSSPQRLKIFRDFQKKLKLNVKQKQKIDCITRWNSTFHMLEKAVQCEGAFSGFHLVESFKHPPSENDWLVAKELCKFLKVFDDSTNVFSFSHIPTSNLYFYQVCMIDSHLRSEWANPIIIDMQKKMKDKFSQYWDGYSMILSIAVIFDPRHKFDFVEFCLRKVYGVKADSFLEKVWKNLRLLFEWYTKVHITTSTQQEENEQDNEIGGSCSMPFLGDENRMQEYYHLKKKTKKSLPTKNELDLYLEEEVHASGVPFDVLDFWSAREVNYPILASIARDILAIPVSTVASESAFSTGSRVISDKRSCLKTSTIEALICAQDWLRGSFSHDEDIHLEGFVDEGCDEESGVIDV